jgi:uncharacterized tellurite resistance protein B-like protein
MKSFLNNIFGEQQTTAQPKAPSSRDFQVATAALLLEIARIDDEFTDDERAVIIKTMKDHFGITAEEVEEILEATDAEIEKSLDLYHFTNRINEHFDLSQKIKIIEMVWRVIYTDQHLNGHEDFLVHRIAKLLRLQHSQLIDAKLRVKGEK